MTLRLIIAAAFLGLAAFYLARGVGIPAWQSWIAGDATDIGALVFFAVLFLGTRL